MTSKRHQASVTNSQNSAGHDDEVARALHGSELLHGAPRGTDNAVSKRDAGSKRDVVSRRSVLSGLFVSAAAVGCSSFIDSTSSDSDTPASQGSGSSASGSSASGSGASGSASGSNESGASQRERLPEANQEVSQGAPTNPQSPTATSSAAENSASPESSAVVETPEEPDAPDDEDPRMVEIDGDGSGEVEVTEEDLSEAPDTLPDEPITMGKTAADRVVLGASGVEVSRMAMGSGTRGYDYSSDQVKLGAQFGQLLVDAYDQGITFFDCADTYGSHFLAAEAAAKVGRDKVQILTKSHATTREEMEADLERFLEELGTDYIDILLLHNRSSPTWTEDFADCMEVLADAKQAGKIRAHGVSCHSIEATQLACRTDWVDVNLIRINPFNLHMDADPTTVLAAIDQAKAANHGVIGMKILGAGQAINRMDEAINHAIRLDSIDAFTIGFTSRAQMDEVTAKIAAVTPA